MREAFAFESDDVAIFVHKPQKSIHPDGVFTFNQQKELNGPALIVHANGRPKVLLRYSKNKRNGTLRCWDNAGFLVLLSEYKAGNKLGITCLCKEGHPVLIEEWDTSRKPVPYFIELKNDGARAISVTEASKPQQAAIGKASAEVQQLERDLFKDEGRWKESFRNWWNHNDDDLKALHRALKLTPDPKAQKQWKTKIEDLVKAIKSDAKKESEMLFNALP